MSLTDFYISIDDNNFSRNKNEIRKLIDCSILMNPSQNNLELLQKQHKFDINMITTKLNLNIVMAICLWKPTFPSIAKEWILLLIKNGLDVKHKDINGKTTTQYIKEYYN